MPEMHEYLIAWTIYLVAGVGCCAVWWKITARLGGVRVFRDFLRGLAVVAIFTPWYAAPGSDHYAPASLVLLIDIFLQGAKGGLKGGVALLFMLFVMLLVLVLRQTLWRPKR